jgi:AmmeMemoRadiSam system protein B
MGIGLSTKQWFETPLGRIEVDIEEVTRLLALGEPFVEANEAHAPEHCLEVELPFLQHTLDAFKIVPMLLGSDVDLTPLTEDLAEHLGAAGEAMLVASSDLSHYLPYDEAQRTDARFLENVLRGDTEKVKSGDACGRLAIALVMDLARRLGWSPHLLAYANSGDTCGSSEQVVGYCAIAYTESST